MSLRVRVTIKAGEARHYINMVKRYWDAEQTAIMDHLEQEGLVILRDEVPKRSGELAKSCWSMQYHKGKVIHFGADAEYADIINGDGVSPESPGRYVPAIGKRLVSEELSTRGQVYKEAKKRGYSERAARAAYETPMRVTKWPGKAGEETTLGVFYGARLKSKKVPGEEVLKPGGPKRATGLALVKTGLSKERRKQVERHELIHAVQWKAGESWLDKDLEAIETAADYMETTAAGQKKDIGTHPGSTQTPFFENTLERLFMEAEERMEQALQGMPT